MNKGGKKKGVPTDGPSLPSLAYSQNLVPGSGILPGRRLRKK